MAYEISVTGDEKVVNLRFSGDSDAAENQRARDEVVALCAERGLTRMLVDMTEVGSIMSGQTLDLFRFGEDFAKGMFPQDARIAVVEKDPNPDVDFVVTVARNRGFLMEVFDDRDKALAWLK